MNVAVVGGGWAGLAAAVELANKAHKVTVFEASATLGGRARSVAAPHLGITIDNGQHILLGAYSHTLALINALTGNAEQRLCRLPLTVQSADGSFRLKAGSLPAPWHLLWAVASAKGMGLQDRLRLARLCHNLKSSRQHVPDDWTVAQWLTMQRQSDAMVHKLWQPLCLAAMNTPIDQACARTFCRVLRDALCGTSMDTGAGMSAGNDTGYGTSNGIAAATNHDIAAASNLLIPRTGLSDLWLNHLPENIVVHCSQSVTRVVNNNNHWRINGQDFDATILACPPPAVARLLGPLQQGSLQQDGSTKKNQAKIAGISTDTNKGKGAGASKDTEKFLHSLDAFTYLPIATLTLQFASVWKLPFPMLMLTPHPERHHYGQWLFNLNGVASSGVATVDSANACCATVVISDARALLGLPRDDIANAIMEQVTSQTRHFGNMPKLSRYELIIEKRATFAATPQLHRPANKSPWPGLWLAGDWTDTGYPAVLEGAVRSGQNAARGLMGQA